MISKRYNLQRWDVAGWIVVALMGLVIASVVGCALPTPGPPTLALGTTDTPAPTARPPALAYTAVAAQTQPVAPSRTPSATAKPTQPPTPTPRPTLRAPSATPTEAAGGVIITIVYDNNPCDDRLETAWGFSCLVEGLEKTLLFDTGGDSGMLLRNMRKLGIDPAIVDVIVISHVHYDHVGGLQGFLKANNDLTVYLPRSLPENIKNTVREAGATLVEVDKPLKICERVYSTGQLGTWIKEQALVVETSEGLIVITGCAHPGVVSVVEEAKRLVKSDVHLVLGGFHLCWMNGLQIKGVVEGIKSKGVEKVAPCHCSGDLARKTFDRVYGKDFILVGVGRTLEVGGWKR